MFQSADYPSQDPAADPSGNKKKSILPTCLIGCLVLFVIMLILGGVGIWWGFKYGPAMLAEKVGDAVIQEVNNSDMPAEEKAKVAAQIERFQAAVKNNEVGLQELEQAMQRFTESPLITLAVVQAVQEKYIAPSGLAEEEKEAGRLAVQRVARGVVEKKIAFSEVEPAMELIADKDANGNWQLKNQVDDATLRQFLERCTALADQADIPMEEYEFSIGDELKKILDDVLPNSP